MFLLLFENEKKYKMKYIIFSSTARKIVEKFIFSNFFSRNGNIFFFFVSTFSDRFMGLFQTVSLSNA